MKIQDILGGFCEIPLAKICVKSPRFGTDENVEITVKVSENLRLADLLIGNDLFQVNSKFRDPIEIVNFDVYPSPVMDQATSSEPIGNQMSVTCSEQNVEKGELATSGDQIAESVVTFVNSEIVMPSSDPTAVVRSQYKQESDVDDGNTGSVTLPDETNRKLRDMDMCSSLYQKLDGLVYLFFISTTEDTNPDDVKGCQSHG